MKWYVRLLEKFALRKYLKENNLKECELISSKLGLSLYETEKGHVMFHHGKKTFEMSFEELDKIGKIITEQNKIPYIDTKISII